MIRINLLKPETKEIRDAEAVAAPEFKPEKKSPKIGNLIFLALILVLIGFFWVQKRARDNETRLLDAARIEKQRLAYVTAKLDEVTKQRVALIQKITLINALKSQQDLAVRIIDAISRNLPDWVWLTESSFDSKGVQIKGKAISNNLIADYISNLEASDVFENVNLISSTLRKDQRTEFLDFALSMSLEQPTPAALAPPSEQARPKVKRGGAR